VIREAVERNGRRFFAALAIGGWKRPVFGVRWKPIELMRLEP
jgi:hypothetical protein